MKIELNIMKKYAIILMFLFTISCFKLGQPHKGGLQGIEQINLDGVVISEFSNQWGDYFFKKSIYIDCAFINYYHWGHLSSIDEYCGLDTLSAIYKSRFENPQNDLSNYSQVRNQNKEIETDTVNYYYGGDLYYVNDNKDIAVAFRLKGKGLKFNKACKAYIKEERYRGTDCPEIDKKDEFKVPFIALVEIDTIFSLSVEDQVKYGLTVCPEKYFEIGFCD